MSGVLVTSDWHLNSNPRDEYRHRFQEQLREQVRKRKVSCVLMLGDLTEEKDFHSSSLVNQISDHIFRLSKLCPVVILKGNHDYTSAAGEAFFAFLSRFSNVSFLGAPSERVHLENAPRAALEPLGTVLFMPHSYNFERDWEAAGFREAAKEADWLFAHNTFAGARGDNGQELTGISISLFPKSLQVVSGDVHGGQTLGKNVMYVGAPYTVKFGDDFAPRMVLIEGDDIQSIPCSGPQKRLVDGKVINGNKWTFKHTQESEFLNPGDILKVQLTIKQEDYVHWSEIKDNVYQWAADEGYIVDIVRPVLELQNSPRMVKQNGSAARSDSAIMKDYVKKRGVDERTAKVGLDIMEKS